ncbi:MAG: hypothetical protein E7463_01325 [Ruminococcaceae bacterium]|nr:hypothetical protein [Oscillospiraceae bacterium]
MAKLHDLKNIVDEKLGGVHMTEEQKARVRKAVQAEAKPVRRRARYSWAASAAAAVLAVVMLGTIAIPNLPGKNPAMTTDSGAVQSSNPQGQATATGSTTALETMAVIDVASQLEIIALNEDDGSVRSDSGFLIRSDAAVSLSQLASMITLSPDVSFSLVEQGQREFLLKPDSPLARNTLLNINVSVEDELLRSWAFQTGKEMSVVATLPADESNGMPLNTGIEITFSDSFADAQSHFSISPAVAGRFETNGNTLVFIPEEELKKDTIYRVTVSAGVIGDGGETLEEDYSFAFRTPADYNERIYLIDNFTESYLPEDQVIISLDATEGFDDKTFRVNLYKLESADEYLALAEEHENAIHPALGKSFDVTLDVSGYETAMSFETRLYRQENYWWDAPHIIFPETPAEGWYLADVSIEDSDRRIQKLIQVSSLSVHTQSVNGETIIWVNDTQTGSAAQDAGITLQADDQTVNCVTDANGLAMCSLDTAQAQLQIRLEDRVFADRIMLAAVSEQKLSDQYYAILYTDRAAYLPSDTIHFWGKLSPKTDAAQLPESLDIYFDDVDSARLLNVRVSADGVFTGAIEYIGRTSGSSNLIAAFDGEQITSAWFVVSDYTKPVYILNMETDKQVYGPGEAVQVRVTGTFYDGTPAQGLEIAVHHDLDVNGSYGISSLVLDEQGCAEYSFIPGHREGSWEPYYSYISCNTSSAEDVWVGANATVRIFRGDRMLKVENLAQEGIELRINANELLIDRYEPGMEQQEMLEALTGSAASVSGTVIVYECGYERRETGSYYNHILKHNIVTYDYDYVETVIDSRDFQTRNGEWAGSPLDVSGDSNVWYRAEVYYTDSEGRAMKEMIGLSNGDHPGGYANNYYFYADQALDMRIDEERVLTLSMAGEAVQEGRMLVSLSQDSFLRCDVQQAGDYLLRYTKDAVPDIYINGAYFDGKHVYKISSSHASYDATEQGLHISIHTDKESYEPGDTVKAVVTVMDENHQPVSADIVLSVVDNAALAILEPDFEPLSMLYSGYRFAKPVTYSSYRSRTTVDYGMAEGGGETGGDAIREDFEDTAAFIKAQTDPQGRANITFHLPHNLTSWRMSVVAMESRGELPKAGMESRSLSATLPFFLNAVVNDCYLAQDDVSISLRSAGTGLQDLQERVDYHVEIAGNGKTRVRQVSGNAGSFVYVNLGTLPEGVYTLTIGARTGEYKDTVKKTFEVTSSRHEMIRYQHGDLSDGISVSSLRYPVTIQLYDLQQQTVLRALSRAKIGGHRLDAVLAGLLESNLQEKRYNTNTLSSYMDHSGGLRLFTYGSADAEVTAQAMIACSEWFDAMTVKEYLYSVLADQDATSTEVTAAYMGLAVWREPILRDVRLLLEEEENISLTDQLYLVTALALLGDDAGVDTWLAEKEAAVMGEKDANLRYSGLCRLLTLAVIRGDAENTELLLDKVLTEKNEYISPAFALCTYLSRAKNQKTSSAVLTYSGNGELRELKFDRYWVQTLKMSESELQNADFKVTNGTIGYTLRYTDTIPEASELSGITIEQQYEQTQPAVGDLVRVNVIVSGEAAKDGMLSLVIPSGMRFVSTDPDQKNTGWYLVGEEAGRLQLKLTGREQYEISCYVRCVLPGNYYAEASVFSASDSNEPAVGTGTQITIHE